MADNKMITTLSSKMKRARKELTEKASELRYDAFHSVSSPLYGPARKFDDIKGARQRAFRGYDGLATFIVGDFICSRVASTLEMLSKLSYDEVDPDWFEALRPTSDALKAYRNTDELTELMMTRTFKGTSTPGGFEEDPLLGKALSQINDSFINNWNRAAELLFLSSYPLPIEAVEVSGDATGFQEKARRVALKADAARARIRDASAVSLLDIAAGPAAMLRFFGTLLYEFASDTIAYSEGYLDRGEALYEREPEWMERQAITAAFFGDKSLIREVSDGISTIAPNSESPDWSAWIEDVVDAGRTLDLMADWIAPDGLKASAVAAGVADDVIDEMDERIRGEFTHVWEWLGQRMDSLAQ